METDSKRRQSYTPGGFDPGPPCLSQAVGGFVRTGIAGVAWGLFMGSYDARKLPDMVPARKVLYVAKGIAKSGLTWGGLAAAYFGLRCGFETSRQKRDWGNATIAGALTGALFAASSGNPKQMMTTAAIAAVLTTAGDYLQPPEY